MKKYVAIALSVISLSLNVFADPPGIPRKISYQGVLINQSSGAPIQGTYDIMFVIYSDVAGANELWSELRSGVILINGTFSEVLGQTTPADEGTIDISFNEHYYIKVILDPNGTPTEFGPYPLLTVPYSYRAIGLIGPNSTATGVGVNAGGSNSSVNGNFSLIGGGELNSVTGEYSTISGGLSNNIENSARSYIGGGQSNESYLASHVTIGGGYANYVRASYSTVGGGESNAVEAQRATVGGGSNNNASGTGSVIGGGYFNVTEQGYSTIAGGEGNETKGSYYSAIGGGSANSTYGMSATISGGELNVASGSYSTVSGGSNNRSRGQYAVVSGGGGTEADSNSAIGDYSSIPGGTKNKASGNYSFAAGRRAKAIHNGSFVWADQTDADFSSSTTNEFNIRASGGVRMYTNSGLTAGVTLAAGGSSWSTVSDSTLKQNIRLVNTKEVLNKVSRLPIKQWSYKSQFPSIEHIGPMAQDFYEIFGLGDDNKSISTIDPSGIAIAAIQELSKRNNELASRIAELEAMVKSLIAKNDNTVNTFAREAR